MFSQKGEELKATREAERNFRMLFGSTDNPEYVVVAQPDGDIGPPIVMRLPSQWMIEQIGDLSGPYTVVGQVNQVLQAGEQLPTLRLTRTAPPTPLELAALRESVDGMVAPAQGMGIVVSSSDAAVDGPCLSVTPAAIFR